MNVRYTAQLSATPILKQWSYWERECAIDISTKYSSGW